MKKILLVAAIITMAQIANSQNRWSIGVMLGAGVNVSELSGGSENANALFSNAPHKTGGLGVYARYKLCDHLSLQSGYDFSEIGFTYLFAKNYSLKKGEKDHFNEMKTSTCISRMPVMMIYSSKLNCRNLRFIAGSGFALNVVDKNWKSEYRTSPLECPTGMSEEQIRSYISDAKSYEAHSTTGGNASFTWLFGTEKVFKKGSMLNITLQGNFGFSPLATSTIQYNADGTSYRHTFTNKGSYCSLGFSYFFMPIGSRKLLKIQDAGVKL
jgi:hypothetical protein